MQFYDGQHSSQILKLYFDDQSPETCESIAELISNHLEDMGGPNHFLGAILMIDDRCAAVAYVLHYPGRIALLTGPRLFERSPASTDYLKKRNELAIQMCQALASMASQRWDLELLQASQLSTCKAELACLGLAGFVHLADLNHLEARPQRPLVGPEIPDKNLADGWRLYDSADRELFTQWLEATYSNTMDCPLMNSLRTIESTMAGYLQTAHSKHARKHLSSSVPLPQWWIKPQTIDSQSGSNQTVILAGYMLTVIAPQIWELTYMGIADGCRQQGLGHETIAQAMHQLRQLQAESVYTYVDEKNIPAMKLYRRYGFEKIAQWTSLYWPKRLAT